MKPLIDRFLYALIVTLSLLALWLLLNTPPDFLNSRVVYQGF